jgi:hypothetical protein
VVAAERRIAIEDGRNARLEGTAAAKSLDERGDEFVAEWIGTKNSMPHSSLAPAREAEHA